MEADSGCVKVPVSLLSGGVRALELGSKGRSPEQRHGVNDCFDRDLHLSEPRGPTLNTETSTVSCVFAEM